MRKFIVLVLLGCVGYYFYSHQDLWRKLLPAGSTSLKGPFAWKIVTRDKANAPYNISVELMDGTRWRVEARTQGSSKTVVALNDGTRTVSNTSVSAEILAPQAFANRILSLAAKTSAVAQRMTPQVTEQRDGHTCWRTTAQLQGTSVNIWIDARSHFPVCIMGNESGKLVEFHCSPLELDFARRGSEFFNPQSREPLFSDFLTP